MATEAVQTPAELVAVLSRLFPAFATEWSEAREGASGDDYTFHAALMEFAPISAACFDAADSTTRERFCDLLNSAVAAGGDLENAVATCLLEHASQIGIRQLLSPYLSAEAKRELR